MALFYVPLMYSYLICFVRCRLVLTRQSSALRGTGSSAMVANWSCGGDGSERVEEENEEETVEKRRTPGGAVTSSGTDSDTAANTSGEMVSTAASTRHMFVQFSPVAPMTVSQYRITSSGPEGISYYYFPA